MPAIFTFIASINFKCQLNAYVSLVSRSRFLCCIIKPIFCLFLLLYDFNLHRKLIDFSLFMQVKNKVNKY